MIPLALAAMVATAAIAPLLARHLGRNAGYPLAAAFLLIGGLLMARAPEVLDGGTISESWAWMPSIGVTFRLGMDGLTVLFIILVLGVGALILAYCPRYLSVSRRHGRFYCLLAVFATAMLGLVTARDLVLVFVFWELTTVSSFLLIADGGREHNVQPARRALVVTAGGGLTLLAAVAMTGVVAGTTDVDAILADPAVVTDSPWAPAIAVLVMVSAFTKSAQLPFHFWLPDAMVAITPVSAYLHAATMVKAGVYVLMRFTPLLGDLAVWSVTLIAVGLASAVVGAAVALKQHDLKALLAYSTISQLGLITALTGVGSPAALEAAALHAFAHALFKATLFMLVGIIDKEAGSRDVREISGLRRVMPVTAVLTALAAASLAGVPPLVGFVSKEEAFEAFLDAGTAGWVGWVVAGTAVTASSLTFAYGFRLVYGAFGGPTTQPDLYEPKAAFLAPTVVPAVFSLILGVAAGWLNPLVDRAAADMTTMDEPTDLALWHGFTPALGLSAVTVMIGLSLFFAREPVDRRLQEIQPPTSGAAVFDGLYAGSLRAGAWVGRPTRTNLIGNHLAWPLASVIALGLVGVAVVSPRAPVLATAAGADWFVAGLLLVAVGALCITSLRLAAVALVGLAGFTVGVWFILVGAPDLAITQLLVETLVVIVAVLVLRRLPRRFRPTARRRAVAAGVAAVAAGLLAGAVTFVATGRRERSATADYLLREGYELSGGRNVVNTVLVDFRALDTLGETAVLAVAALGLMAVYRYTSGPGRLSATGGDAPSAVRGDSLVVVQVGAALLVPVIVTLTAFLLLRGHYEPGGGFIAALVLGAGIALARLPRGFDQPMRLRAEAMVRAGLAICVAVGFWGLADGSFLRPLRTGVSIGPVDLSLTSSLVFDIGVLLVAAGLIAVAVDRLGSGALSDGRNPSMRRRP